MGLFERHEKVTRGEFAIEVPLDEFLAGAAYSFGMFTIISGGEKQRVWKVIRIEVDMTQVDSVVRLVQAVMERGLTVAMRMVPSLAPEKLTSQVSNDPDGKPRLNAQGSVSYLASEWDACTALPRSSTRTAARP